MFIAHCKKRQDSLYEFPDLADFERTFESELKIGQDFQLAYQKYEEEQIAAGRALDDPTFYDAFNTRYGNIATPVGDADFLAVQEPTQETMAWLVFAIGAFVFLVALNQLFWVRRKRAKA